MLWPIVLPFLITVCIISGLIAVVTVLAPRGVWRRASVFCVASGLGVLGFVPACTCVMHVLDAKRFGVFTYATFDEVNDFRVERYLPPAAQGITLDKRAQGFRARYTINETELLSYLDELWDKYGEHSLEGRQERPTPSIVRNSHGVWYEDLGWPSLDDAIEYRSPSARNGAGFFVWYSRKERIAYQRAGYW